MTEKQRQKRLLNLREQLLFSIDSLTSLGLTEEDRRKGAARLFSAAIEAEVHAQDILEEINSIDDA